MTDLTTPPARVTPIQADREALKPCPFCGGEAEIEPKNWAGRDYIGVFCKECLIFQDSRSATNAEAIAAWNTRHLSEREQAVREALEGAFITSECGGKPSRYVVRMAFPDIKSMQHAHATVVDFIRSTPALAAPKDHPVAGEDDPRGRWSDAHGWVQEAAHDIGAVQPTRVTADANIEQIARRALLNTEIARTDVVNPANGLAPYSFVLFHGERIKFYDDEFTIDMHRDAGSSKAAAYATKINGALFELAKKAAALAHPADALAEMREELEKIANAFEQATASAVGTRATIHITRARQYAKTLRLAVANLRGEHDGEVG